MLDLAEVGILEGMEQFHICEKALSFLGMPYGRSEELSRDSIDCSTLTSQSYWEGAFITIPFVSERQRQSGKTIESISHAEAGDIVVKYESIEEVPERDFNHVGLYLGEHDGQKILIESCEGRGVKLSTIENFNPKGGIKRYWLSKEKCEPSLFNKIHGLAKRVPKLGRIGARQYHIDVNKRQTHSGTDIYLPLGTAIFAIVSGLAQRGFCEDENSPILEILSSDQKYIAHYKNIMPCVDDKQEVVAGELIGHLYNVASQGNINYSHFLGGKDHLHIEIIERCEDSPIKVSRKSLNPLYMAKTGEVMLPVEENREGYSSRVLIAE